MARKNRLSKKEMGSVLMGASLRALGGFAGAFAATAVEKYAQPKVVVDPATGATTTQESPIAFLASQSYLPDLVVFGLGVAGEMFVRNKTLVPIFQGMQGVGGGNAASELAVKFGLLDGILEDINRENPYAMQGVDDETQQISVV